MFRRQKRYGAIIVITLQLVFTFVTTASAGILMYHKGLSSHADFLVYCKKEINLYLQTTNSSCYEEDNTELQQIVDSSRDKLQERCPNIEKIVINGSLGGEWYYRGESTRAKNWRVAGNIIGDDSKYYEPYMFPNDSDSIYKLALMYITGERLVTNYSEAASLLKKGARMRHADSQYALAILYEKGLVPRENNSKNKAMKWLQDAADQGHSEALEHLGQQEEKTKLVEQRKIETEKAARRPGVVYKSDRFWQEFSGFTSARKVFEGDFSGLASSIEFKNYYIDFVEDYSSYCKKFLPAEKDLRNGKEIFGSETYGPVTKPTVFEIDPQFTPAYDKYNKDVEAYNKLNIMKNAFQIALESRTQGLGNAFQNAVTEIKAFEMNKFFSKVGCESATMHQMQNNMLRAATNKKSIQSDGISLKNAANESDSVESIVRKKTFEQACLYYHNKRDISSSNDRWCNCLNREARKVMTPAELIHFADDFGSYYTEVDNKQNGPNDPRWRLQEPLNKCRR